MFPRLLITHTSGFVDWSVSIHYNNMNLQNKWYIKTDKLLYYNTHNKHSLSFIKLQCLKLSVSQEHWALWELYQLPGSPLLPGCYVHDTFHGFLQLQRNPPNRASMQILDTALCTSCISSLVAQKLKSIIVQHI